MKKNNLQSILKNLPNTYKTIEFHFQVNDIFNRHISLTIENKEYIIKLWSRTTVFTYNKLTRRLALLYINSYIKNRRNITKNIILISYTYKENGLRSIFNKVNPVFIGNYLRD
jgi:hypothetical protein